MNVAPSSGDAILQVEAYQRPELGARAPFRWSATWSATRPAGPTTANDVLGCLTCHVAHGSSQVMTGWASASLTVGNGTNGVASGSTMPVRDNALGGVDPTFDSSLLRADDRTVCEACHEK